MGGEGGGGSGMGRPVIRTQTGPSKPKRPSNPIWGQGAKATRISASQYKGSRVVWSGLIQQVTPGGRGVESCQNRSEFSQASIGGGSGGWGLQAISNPATFLCQRNQGEA